MVKAVFTKNLSFKQKILLIISTFGIILVLMISFFNIKWHSDQMVLQTQNQTQQIVELLLKNIDSYINELYRLTLTPYYNDTIMHDLEAQSVSPEAELEKKRRIEDFLSSVMILPRDEILRVYILTDQERYSYIRTPYEMKDYLSYREAAWYKQALSASRPVLIPIHSEKVFGNQKTSVVSIARRIRSKEDNRKLLGVIKVDADHSVIKSLGDKITFEYHGGLFIVSDSGETIYKRSNINGFSLPDELPGLLKAGAYYTDRNGHRYICNTARLEESGIRIIALNSYQDIVTSTLKNITRTILWIVLSFGIALSLLFLLIKRFLAPLYQVVDAMKQVKAGNLSVQVPVNKQDEIGYLADSFNAMTLDLEATMKRNAELLTEVYETNYLHKASQYEALCNQIKPHFIHNTLNTISLLIKCGDLKDSVSCIENLSLFLRGVMQADQEIPLEMEVKLAESYLAICKIRYGDRLRIENSLQPECPDYDTSRKVMLPALTIQPLVENSIKHGCEKVSRPITITLTSYTDKESLLHILVSDNGTGISECTLLLLKERMAADTDPLVKKEESLMENSIGLINVHRRLRLKYGDKAGLHLSSDETGTQTEIIIPSC